MSLRVVVLDTAAEVAARGAAVVAERARATVGDRGRFSLALSGGSTPWAMIAALRAEDMPWTAVEVFQVDERVAPDGDPERNLTHLQTALPADAHLHAMHVGMSSLEDAAASYAGALPDRLDLVHLGLGADGHTASLVPGDPVLEVRDRDVAVTGVYQGHRRLTLTYPVLDRAAVVLWLVTGTGKREALRRLLDRDPSIPATRVMAGDQLVLADRDAAG